MHHRYGGPVLSLAYSILGDRAHAEEVVLDLFLRCWNGEETHDSSQGTLQTWLLIQTRRLALAAHASRSTDVPPQPLALPDVTGPGPGSTQTVRGLRERLLARARGEIDGPPTPQEVPPAAPPEPEPRPTPTAAPVQPPVQLDEPLPPPRLALEPIPSTRVPQRPRQQRIRLASLGWAAALLFVLASGLFVGAWSATGPHASPTVELQARLPGGRVLRLAGTGVPTAKARLFVVEGGRRAELAVDRLPPPPAGRVYQVWFAEPGEPVKTGGAFTVDARGDAVARVTIPAPLERVRRISVTEEAAPGSANPSGTELLLWTP